MPDQPRTVGRRSEGIDGDTAQMTGGSVPQRVTDPSAIAAAYEAVLRRAEADPDVVGLVLMGSRGYGGYVREASDYDILVIVADRKSTRLNSSHIQKSRMPSSA